MFFSKNAPEWIAVFLGNPGDKYRDTRHNVGFMTADTLAQRQGVRITKLKYSALTGTCAFGGHTVLLMKPQTFMNLSGRSVRQAAKFYKIPPERIVVVSDDVTLDVGRLRIRRKGSDGGHNGLKSIISELGSDAFPRIKLGVGTPDHPDDDRIDWVLGKFQGKDHDEIEKALVRAADALETIVTEGVDAAMNRFN